MKAFAIIRMQGGQPEINPEETPYHGYVLCDQLGQWGAYLISGTPAQLRAIDKLSHVYGICAVTESGDVRWRELDDAMTDKIRNRLNTWLENRGQQTIPEGWSNRRVVRAIFRRFNAHFDLDRFDVADVPEEEVTPVSSGGNGLDVLGEFIDRGPEILGKIGDQIRDGA